MEKKHAGSEEKIASWQSWAATLESHRLRLAEDESQVLRSEIFYKGHSQSRMLNSGADALDHFISAKVLPPWRKHFTRSTVTKQFPSHPAAVWPSWHRNGEKGEKNQNKLELSKGYAMKGVLSGRHNSQNQKSFFC